MTGIVAKGGNLPITINAVDDFTLTLNFTGYTLTGHTLAAVVTDQKGTTIATLTATVVDADTATVAYDADDLTANTSGRWSLRDTTAGVTLLAGTFTAGDETTPGVSTSATATVSVVNATATVTAVLGLSEASVAASIATHAAATDPHGDRAFATAAVATHEADTTSVHGITDTAALVLRTHRLFDRGERLMSKLRLASADAVIAVFGDSTSNETTEWAYLLADALGDSFPARKVDYTLWSDGSQAYPAVSTLQAGTAPSGVLFLDNFNRSGALEGSTPDIGNVWGVANSNANGDFTTNGTQAVHSGQTTVGYQVVDLASTADTKITVPLTVNTTATGSFYQFWVFLRYINTSNYVAAYLHVDSSGTSLLYIEKRIAAVSTTLATGLNPLTANTADQTATFTFQVSGTALSATLGAATATGTLTAGDVTALAAAQSFGIFGMAGANPRLDSVTVETVGTVSPQSLTMYNCSVAGSTIEYQAARLATVLPVAPDLLAISTGHNFGATTSTGMESSLDSLIAAVRALHPSCGIVITSQNPQKPPSSTRVGHLERQAALASYCRTRGVGYVDTIESWMAESGGGVTMIGSDGVHPNSTGSAYWADLVADYLTAV